ncbi:MAG: helix-turn-helix domain-containing protein [Candidatus Roizmanbacteria bacterium]
MKNEREKQGLTLEDISKATKIRVKQLAKIEQGYWKSFSSRTYIQGIIKVYGAYLKLPEDKLLAFFRREYERKDANKFSQKLPENHYTPLSRKIFWVLTAAATFLFVLYFGYQLTVYLSPPEVKIISPTSSIIKRKSKFELQGETEKDSRVLVNKRAVYLDEKNVFRTMIPIPDKKVHVHIEVTGANGKTTTLDKDYTKE